MNYCSDKLTWMWWFSFLLLSWQSCTNWAAKQNTISWILPFPKSPLCIWGQVGCSLTGTGSKRLRGNSGLAFQELRSSPFLATNNQFISSRLYISFPFFNLLLCILPTPPLNLRAGTNQLRHYLECLWCSFCLLLSFTVFSCDKCGFH